MKFCATSKIGEIPLTQRYFDTNDTNFTNQIRHFSDESGREFSKQFMLEIMKNRQIKIKEWHEITVTREIFLNIFYGDIYDPRILTGDCQAQFEFTVKAADPGIYEEQLIEMDKKISNLLYEEFAKYFDFIDWEGSNELCR